MDALTYIEQIYESANGMKVPLTGGNSMVNILVNNAQQQAASCSVPLTANIMVPPELPVETWTCASSWAIFWTMPWRHAAVWVRVQTGSSTRKSAARRHS